jgi:hypothetical protein
MAKTTKKSESKDPAAKKPAAAKKMPAKKAAKPAAAGDAPMIDTDLAAQAAARMLLAKPALLSHLLGPGGDKKKAGPQFNLNQQRGHNQTFGGTNTGVPRRTNG